LIKETATKGTKLFVPFVAVPSLGHGRYATLTFTTFFLASSALGRKHRGHGTSNGQGLHLHKKDRAEPSVRSFSGQNDKTRANKGLSFRTPSSAAT
jgi:hypothetical protein